MTLPPDSGIHPNPDELYEDEDSHLRLRFIHAAADADLTLMEALLAAGALVNGRSPRASRATALIYATANRQERDGIKTARWLLDRGADPNLASKEGVTPLMTAAAVGRPGVIALLAAAGADMDPQDDFGRSALHHAARSGSDGALLELLRLGADPALADQAGRTPADSPALSPAARATLRAALEALELNAGLPASPSRPARRV